MKPVREAIALNMHPWLIPEYDTYGHVKSLSTPSWSTVLEAADRLIEGLKEEGYEITTLTSHPRPLEKAVDRAAQLDSVERAYAAEIMRLRAALEDTTYPLGEVEGLMSEVKRLKTLLSAARKNDL